MEHWWLLSIFASSALSSSTFVFNAVSWTEVSSKDCVVLSSVTWLIRQFKIPICVQQRRTIQSSCKTSQVYNLSLEWHHNNVWLTSIYPPYCHCCTWPPGTADGTYAHTCQVCPPALAWCLCAAGCLHSLMTWPASPCRWYSPGIANENISSAVLHD